MSLVDLWPELKPKRSRNGEHAGPCPFCQGEDRFLVWPESDNYWCRRCGKKGDSIQFLREVRGLSFQEAAKQLGKELAPDPWLDRRKQIKAQLEWDYWTWRRAMWRDLLALDHEMRLAIEVAELTYRSVIRAPALWTEQEQADAIETLSALYDRREVVNSQLDLLQSPRHDAEVLDWWREQRG